MAGMITPDECDGSAYCGLASIFEYTNGDGGLRRYNCGQAAAATFLTFHGLLQSTAERAAEG